MAEKPRCSLPCALLSQVTYEEIVAELHKPSLMSFDLISLVYKLNFN